MTHRLACFLLGCVALVESGCLPDDETGTDNSPTVVVDLADGGHDSAATCSIQTDGANLRVALLADPKDGAHWEFEALVTLSDIRSADQIAFEIVADVELAVGAAVVRRGTGSDQTAAPSGTLRLEFDDCARMIRGSVEGAPGPFNGSFEGRFLQDPGWGNRCG